MIPSAWAWAPNSLPRWSRGVCFTHISTMNLFKLGDPLILFLVVDSPGGPFFV